MKSKMIGNFAENLAQTPQYLAKIIKILKS